MYDIYNDSELKNSLQYRQDDRFNTGRIPNLYGVDLYESTLCPIFTGAGSAGANVYGTIIVGQEAFGIVDIGGSGKFEMIVKPLGSAGSDDPLNQRASNGWKAWQIPVILNNNFMTRIETGATIG
jgi:N4-gp56 family major capsid protein